MDGGTLSTVTAASKLSGDVTVLVAGGKGSEQAAKHASRLSGVSQVLHVQSDLFDKPVAEELAALLVNVQKNSAFTHIFSPSTTVSKNFLPRAAALLDVQAISEVIDIKDENTFVRPIYAGNAIATVKSNDSLKVSTSFACSIFCITMERFAPYDPLHLRKLKRVNLRHPFKLSIRMLRRVALPGREKSSVSLSDQT